MSLNHGRDPHLLLNHRRKERKKGRLKQFYLIVFLISLSLCPCPSGIQPKSYQGVSVRAHCEGVYFHVRVLRRTGCHEGVYQYAAAWEKLQTGCACRLATVE